MKSSSPGRLRIAFVVHDYNRHHGHSRYVAELATRFRREHEVHVFANTFEEPDSAGITYHHVPAIRGPALASILSFVLPGTLCVPDVFDVIHAQGLCGLRHDVCTAHFCQEGWYRNLLKQRTLGWSERIFRWLVTPLERLALCRGRTRRVIAISESVRNDLAKHYYRRRGVDVIYHGVDLETFHPSNRERYRAEVRREWDIPDAEPVALFVGNLQKGAAAAIRTVARVPAVRLVLVSASNPESERKLVSKLGIEERVRFLPATKAVHRAFAAADLFIFPTLYDPFGMVISEAMASGLPVITSRIAGASELIDHGAEGYLVRDPWNVEELVPPLRELVERPEFRDEMGRAARRKIEPYSWDRAAQETMEVYRRVIAGRERRG